MAIAGISYRQTIGSVFYYFSLIVPALSLLLFIYRDQHFPIKRSGRSKLVRLLMLVSILTTLPFPMIERDPTSSSCIAYKMCAILHMPLWITPLLSTQLQFFREARIHSKLADLAGEFGSLLKDTGQRVSETSAGRKQRSAQFDHLVDALKSDRRNLKRNLACTYASMIFVYMLSFTIFIISNSFEGLITENDSMNDINQIDERINEFNGEDGSMFYNNCRLHRGIFWLDTAYGFSGQIFSGLLILFFTREKLRDDFGVSNEFRAVFIISVVFILAYILCIVLPEEDIWIEGFDPHLIVIAGMNLSFMVLTLLPAVRTFGFFVTKENKAGGLDHQGLESILISHIYPVFVEHLKSEFSVENVLFWKEVENIKAEHKQAQVEKHKHLSTGMGQLLSQHTIKLSYDLAIDVYETFIVRGADMEVNISDNARSKIYQILILEEECVSGGDRRNENGNENENDDDDGNGDGDGDLRLGGDSQYNMRVLTGNGCLSKKDAKDGVPLNIFDEAQAEIFHIMESDSLPRFKTSKIYKNYQTAMSSSMDDRNAYGIELMENVKNTVRGGIGRVRGSTTGTTNGNSNSNSNSSNNAKSERVDRSNIYSFDKNSKQKSQSARLGGDREEGRDRRISAPTVGSLGLEGVEIGIGIGANADQGSRENSASSSSHWSESKPPSHITLKKNQSSRL